MSGDAPTKAAGGGRGGRPITVRVGGGVEPETMSKEEAQANVEGKMNAEQRQVVTEVLSGENVFFHGAAGTGKSFVLQTLVALLKSKNGGGSALAGVC
jgi:DNA replication protein DnaC